MDGQSCAAWSFIRIRCAPTISIILTSCASISIPSVASSGTQVRQVAQVVRATLDEFGLVGWPKTSGSRGMHVCVRIHRQWTFTEVRRAALALAREVERRAPELATSKWWKEERHGVFIDYNQNAKDRTVASAYSVRPTPDARVSAPLTWEESETATRRISRWRRCPRASRRWAIDTRRSIVIRARSTALLELSARHERDGLGDAPWPPQYRKQPGEPSRVQPLAPGACRSIPLHRDRACATGKEDALAGMERWRERHPAAASHLEAADVLVDAMRGRHTTGRASG